MKTVVIMLLFCVALFNIEDRYALIVLLLFVYGESVKDIGSLMCQATPYCCCTIRQKVRRNVSLPMKMLNKYGGKDEIKIHGAMARF